MDTIRLKTVLVLYGVFLTHFAMDLLAIEAMVATANVAQLVPAENARNPSTRIRNNSSSSKRSKR
jgi:hypothetical protein